MIRPLLLLLSALFVAACGKESSTSEVSDASPLEGVFVKGSDTLKVVHDPTAFSKEIDFDFYAANDEVIAYLFNSADFDDYVGEDEMYTFNDSSDVTFEDLVLTFSYENDHWTVQDLVYSQNRDSTKSIDYGGIYTRLE